jgi:hypothetical protein
MKKLIFIIPLIVFGFYVQVYSQELKSIDIMQSKNEDTVCCQGIITGVYSCPIYPLKAAQMNIYEGEIFLKFHLKYREPIDIEIISSTNKIFDDYAIAYIKDCNFRPYKGDSVYYTIPIIYRMK